MSPAFARTDVSAGRSNRAARGTQRRASRGFTLVEIVVVIALIAGATALVAGLLTAGLPGQQLRGAAREIAAQMRFARAQAIVTGEPQVFTLDATARQWHAPRGRHGEVPAAIDVVAVGARDARAAGNVATYRFFPDGASTGGHVRLRNGNAEWRVDIAWLTGEVTLARGGDVR